MHAVQIELIEQALADPFFMPRNSVILHPRRLIRPTHADHINGNGAITGGGKLFNDFAPHK